jgi:NADH-quinone oxidoreductase subunit C
MFGLIFKFQHDLRRLLTDYGFKGFPLRKDFPLSGYIEIGFNKGLGDVIYSPLELSQELRFYNFSSG